MYRFFLLCSRQSFHWPFDSKMAFGLSVWLMVSMGLIFSSHVPPVSAAPQVPCYFIFGDSLVDNGNNNNLNTLAKANYLPYGIDFPGGPTGRFTNGHTVVDIIGKLLGFEDYIPPFATASGPAIIKGVNYGSGSAGIRDETGSQLGDNINFNEQLQNHQTVVSQIASILGSQDSAKEHLGKCLYNVVIGSNDYINNYLKPDFFNTSRLYTPDQYAAILVDQYSQQIMTLYDNGARKIALFGLGSIGCTPAEIQASGSTTCVASINAAVDLFNERLKMLVDELNTELTDARLIYINSYSIQSGDPAIIGLQILNQPCCEVSETGQCIPGQKPCILRDLYLFWDNYHPTEIVNAFVGTRSYAALLASDAYPTDIYKLLMNDEMQYSSMY